jgi:putative flippase GtrA
MVFSSALGLSALAASVLAYAIAAAVAYFGHKVLTFGTPAQAPFERTRFVVASGVGLSLAALIPILLGDFAPQIAFLTVLVLVPVCSFLMMKFFVFRA